MTHRDPWIALPVPRRESTVTARRVDEQSPWNFYWGRDHEGCCLLILRHAASATPRERLPRLKGVEVLLPLVTLSETPSLVLRLVDAGNREIFLRLCLDIIETASAAQTEVEAVAAALSRTWRWHHLLRGGGSGLLSREEQKGLIGELLVLERYMLPILGRAGSLNAWHGPLGSAKDFVATRTAVESKARSTTDPLQVRVSSEFQLDDADTDAVFLHVSIVDEALPDADGFTLTDLVERIREAIMESDEIAREGFDALLAAAGYWATHDYSADRWVTGGQSIFRITAGFPRLTPLTIPAGVRGVRYSVDLAECAPFMSSREEMELALKGGQV